MKSKVLAGVLAVALIAGGVLLFSRNKSSSPEVASNEEAAPKAEEAGMQQRSMKDLLAANKNQTCTFSGVEQGGEYNGTVYLAGKKMRTDSNVKINNSELASHMISDGVVGYMWMDGETRGFKIALESEQAANPGQGGSVDFNKNYNYSCKDWSPDNSKFELPSGVTFNEMPTAQPSAAAGASASGAADVKAMQQAACNNLPEPSKTQCLSAIK